MLVALKGGESILARDCITESEKIDSTNKTFIIKIGSKDLVVWTINQNELDATHSLRSWRISPCYVATCNYLT